VASNTIEQALWVHINSSSAVGSTAASGAFFMRVPSTQALPYIDFFTVDGENLSLAYNASNGGDDTAQPLVQFDIWDNNRFRGNVIAHRLIKILNRHSTAMDGMNIVNIMCRGPRQLNEPDYDNLYHFIVEADIEYERS
jgi:hypothetical protein